MQGYELSRLANLVQHIYESIYNYYHQSIQKSSNKEGIDYHFHIAQMPGTPNITSSQRFSSERCFLLSHQVSLLYKRPNTAASAPAPSIGKAVAAAPESDIASPAALVAELPALPALLVAAAIPLPTLLVALSTTPPLLWEVLLAPDCVASAAKTVVRVRVSVSSWSLGSSSKSVEVVV
jgi:hypothetical protein